MIGWQQVMFMGQVWKIKPVHSLDFGVVADIVVKVTQHGHTGVLYDEYFDVVLMGETQVRKVYPTLHLGDVVFVQGKLRKRRIRGALYLSILCTTIERVLSSALVNQVQDLEPTREEKENAAMEEIVKDLEAKWSVPDDPDLSD